MFTEVTVRPIEQQLIKPPWRTRQNYKMKN